MEKTHLIDVVSARRLALCRAGLLRPEWVALPRTAGRGESRARQAAHSVIRTFGYLQLDTVSVAGARSHAIVVGSRLNGFKAELGEALLQLGEPLFEYWAHEVCWIPIELYPLFGWRRKRFRRHPWWGDVIGRHPELARDILERIRQEGPIKSTDLEGASGKGWWNLKPAKSVAVALWSSGDLAIRERRAFQRTFDLPERVIPARWLSEAEPDEHTAIQQLLLRALAGHGWAQRQTLVQTFRLLRLRAEVERTFRDLSEAGEIVPCTLVLEDGKRSGGWIRPADLELAARLKDLRRIAARPVLLSPFDPLLWDRKRAAQLFGFEMTVEIFVPASRRKYGYYCLPVLAGERLIGRVDLKADRKRRQLRIVSRRLEEATACGLSRVAAGQAVREAVLRHAGQVELTLAKRMPT